MEVEYRYQADSKIQMILGVPLIDAVDAPPPARECHEGGVLLRPLRLEGANHADDHNFRKLIADRVTKRNGTWHMTRHKGDENAAPENWSGAVIRRPCGAVGAGTRNTLANLDCQYPVNDEYAEPHQSISLARCLNGRPRLL